MSRRLSYDDERTVHSEGGGYIWFPADLCDRGSAIAEVAAMSGCAFWEFTASKVYMVQAPIEETPSDFDFWWTVANRRHPDATAFWEVRSVGAPRSREPALPQDLEPYVVATGPVAAGPASANEPRPPVKEKDKSACSP